MNIKVVEVNIKIVLLSFITAISGSVFGQDGEGTTNDLPPKEISKNLYLGIGLSNTSFQDIRYSTVPYAGIGTMIKIGFDKSTNLCRWNATLNIGRGIENAKTHDQGSTNVLNPTITFQYYKPVNKNIWIGGKFDLMDYYSRNNSSLGNNSGYILSGSHLYVSGLYENQINDKWMFQGGINLGILGFMRESVSFAFSAPQVVLDDGNFNYQDDALTSPFGFKYYNLESWRQFFNLNTHIELQSRGRFGFFYDWHLMQYVQTKDYPMTKGQHNIGVRFNLIQKNKIK